MLDYAANARSSLSIEKMQEWLEDAAKLQGSTTDMLLGEKLGMRIQMATWRRRVDQP